MKRDIGELLVENGQITAQELKGALQQMENVAEPTGRVLLRLGLISEDNLKTVLELHYGVNFLDLKKMSPDLSVISLLPQKVVLQFDVIPVQTAGNRLTLAMVTPSDTDALSKVNELLKDWQLNIGVCSDDGFQHFINGAYAANSTVNVPGRLPLPASPPMQTLGESLVRSQNMPSQMVAWSQTPNQGQLATGPIPVGPSAANPNEGEFIELVEGYGTDAVLLEDQLGKGVDENRSMVLLSHHILSNAINKGCTNIHIEPNDRQVLVHYRKEGVLFPARKLPKSILPELVQRFKIMAAKMAGEVSLPYDGVLNVRHNENEFSFRLSIIPGAFGEHLVIWLE